MNMDINNVILIGRLTKDIELRYTEKTNKACASVDIAVNNGVDKDGKARKADFIRIVAWENQAENLAKYCHKGNRIAVDGKIKTDSYENEKGERRYRTYVLANRIQFLESKEREPLPEEPDYSSNQEQNSTQTQDPFADFNEEIQLSEEDLPF